MNIQKFINKCGAIDIKMLVFLFFIFAVIYSQYGEQLLGQKSQCN